MAPEGRLRDARGRAARIEARLGAIDAFPEPWRTNATEVVRDLLDLYGDALSRVAAAIRAQDPALLERLAEDDLLGHLLILHDLHPLDVAARVTRGLDEVRPYLRSHGGDVELVAIEQGVARLRLRGACHGCPSSLATLTLAIEDAVRKAAPDLEAVEAVGDRGDGTAGPERAPAEVSGVAPGSWVTLGTRGPLGEGLERVGISGASLVLIRREHELYAYRDRCPGCGGEFGEDALRGGVLVCGGCGAAYDVRRAGRPLHAPAGPSLQPFPLLLQDGAVRIALPGAGTAQR